MKKDFLNIIIEEKKKEVMLAHCVISESKLKKEVNNYKGREIRPFFKALEKKEKGKVNIIAEVKRASPSKGDINIDLDPSILALEFENGGAAAISVLTDTKFFKGSFEDFTDVRNVSSIPMLRKEFIISTYQIYESYMLGADAVLLIAKVLPKEKLKELYQLSKSLGMDVLMEVNNMEDLEKAMYTDAKLIGINNRNLNNFNTDTNTSIRLGQLLNKDQVAIAASGIANKQDIEKSLKAGIHNFLIGESIARSKDKVNFLKNLVNH
ncbi:MAG: indole-3-glycerol phosphate synthase TrpC [Desulfobacterales bacterium]|nr:indole-3-glycerol phosphate synthase TrpC [Desulfobacterales bacterium]MCP4163913.1 indole-3-glycerol phosphate synthase TrpC [Deltaproteobacteria bacterium]